MDDKMQVYSCILAKRLLQCAPLKGQLAVLERKFNADNINEVIIQSQKYVFLNKQAVLWGK